METELVTLRYDEDAEAVAQLFARYDFIAAPVVDDQFGLLGIVTHDDVLDVVTREATEDLQRQGARRADRGELPGGEFLERLAEPGVLAGGAVPASDVHDQRDGVASRSELERVAFLVVFIPLCLSVGGNAGSQAATLVIRALALDQIRLRDWLRVFRRELLMALALAAALGVLSVARTYFLTPDNILAKSPTGHFWNLYWVVTLAVMGICLTGALIGAMLPLLIKWSAATRR